MLEIKRILERRFKGENQRSIASSLHLSRNIVSKVFKAADQTGLSWVQFQTMDDSSLDELLFPEKSMFLFSRSQILNMSIRNF
ncbi:hypothetical protein NMU03_01410 [Allocoprobacillus halotolerans]|uniref:Homeodomain-like domain-containing protein n=1 Tax=Allocoprobacillus halotolerans TaxID=2944914 RepID=A0ABY5I2C9_9FIRM|nr:hypothetical protein [Allocoprobacillus halotolerans]UTY39521.1 hypothetical protein NMU03_01410 [Allocoprobacillus halotolerans]